MTIMMGKKEEPSHRARVYNLPLMDCRPLRSGISANMVFNFVVAVIHDLLLNPQRNQGTSELTRKMNKLMRCSAWDKGQYLLWSGLILGSSFEGIHSHDAFVSVLYHVKYCTNVQNAQYKHQNPQAPLQLPGSLANPTSATQLAVGRLI
jgi:hypothetical protein